MELAVPFTMQVEALAMQCCQHPLHVHPTLTPSHPCLQLCDNVMANCFQNASYDPSRNGTCPWKVLYPRTRARSFALPSLHALLFPRWQSFATLGFQRENALRKFVLPYPFC